MRTPAALPLILALALAGAVRADDAPVDPDGPRLSLERKTILFEEVVQGRVLDLKVKIGNTGRAPLVLSRVEPACGCTVMTLPRAPIAPGGSAELELRFDSTEKQGGQSLQILLYSNDPTQTDLGRFCTQLFLQGDVRSVYRVSPAGAFYGEVVRGAAGDAERVIMVLGQSEARAGFTARLVSQAPDYLAVTTEPVPGEGGRPRGVRVRVRLLPHAPIGELSHLIELTTDVAIQPRIRIPVIGIVTGRIVGPDAVQLLRVPRALGAERRLPLERRDGREGLIVRSIEVGAPFITVTTEPVNAQRVDLALRLAPDAPPGPFAVMVRVHLDCEDQPIFEFPVLGLILPRVVVDPPALSLREGATAQALVRGARVLSARPDGEGLRAEVKEEGGLFALTITRTGALPEGGALVVLETDVAGEERVLLRVDPR